MRSKQNMIATMKTYLSKSCADESSAVVEYSVVGEGAPGFCINVKGTNRYLAFRNMYDESRVKVCEYFAYPNSAQGCRLFVALLCQCRVLILSVAWLSCAGPAAYCKSYPRGQCINIGDGTSLKLSLAPGPKLRSQTQVIRRCRLRDLRSIFDVCYVLFERRSIGMSGGRLHGVRRL
jgi:hypothetical protein